MGLGRVAAALVVLVACAHRPAVRSEPIVLSAPPIPVYLAAAGKAAVRLLPDPCSPRQPGRKLTRADIRAGVACVGQERDAPSVCARGRYEIRDNLLLEGRPLIPEGRSRRCAPGDYPEIKRRRPPTH